LWVTLTFSVKESLFKALYPIVQQRFLFRARRGAGVDGQGGAAALADRPVREWRHGTELDAQFGVRMGSC
jgi:enterobactin synthetase component D